MSRKLLLTAAVIACSLAPSVALADEISPALFTANNVWMMLAAALVFIMHLGFATLESGLTRAKNTTNILFKNTFIVSIGITSVLLSLTGLDFITSVSGAATSIANVGPGLGPIIGPAGNFAPLPDAAKWILTIAMFIGRLELLVVLVVVTREFWRS